MLVETLGWTAGAYGVCVALPQLARVVRSRTTAGISLLAWQSNLASSLSWAAYGALNGYLNMWLPCLLVTIGNAWMLIMINRSRPNLYPRLDEARTFGLPVVLASVAISLAVLYGPVAFAIGVFLPAVAAQLLQLRTLMIAPDISAVSWPFLAMGVVGQSLWLSWGVLADDRSNQLVSGCLILLTGVNLTWYLLRRLGVISRRIPAGRAGLVDQVLIDQGLTVPDDEADPDAIDQAVVDQAVVDRAFAEQVLADPEWADRMFDADPESGLATGVETERSAPVEGRPSVRADAGSAVS